MKRVIIKLAVLLFLGAVVNVAVAWGCAYKISPTMAPIVQAGWVDWGGGIWHFRRGNHAGFNYAAAMQAYDSELRGWALAERNANGILGEDVLIHSDELPRWSGFSRTAGTRRFAKWLSKQEWLYGWPFLCLKFETIFDPATNSHSHEDLLQVGYLRLPIGIYWPGFAINTMFYAAILWLLFAAPGRARRWRRIRRGLCIKCAYPIGTSDVCTECGAHPHK